MSKLSTFVSRHVQVICLMLSFSFLFTTTAQQPFPYKDASLPIDERVKDLLSRMTPEEKFWQMFMIPGELQAGKEQQYRQGIFGFQVSASVQASGQGASAQLLQYNTSDNALNLARKINSIQKYFVEKTRLGIPIIAFDEALHGLVREGATAFPQAIALAATFDTALMTRVAHAIAVETKARGIRQILTPVVNIASDVRWGRTEETYGEDPYLSSEMGVAFVRQFEKMGIVTTPKHFLANVGDGGRDSYPIHYTDRLMEELYLPPFRACFERGGSRSVMTSYNSINGSPATASKWLLTDKLKGDWNFKGFVISDAGAVGGANVLHFTAGGYPEATKHSINNGLDVIFQTAFEHYKLFIPPFMDGGISQARIDDAVSRILRAKFELGLFENPYVAESAVAAIPLQEHRNLAREAAAKSFVLLKNDSALPLNPRVRKIAIIGGDAEEARLGGYSGPGNNKINILTGMNNRAGSKVEIRFAEGVARKELQFQTIPSEFLQARTGNRMSKGLAGEYYSNLTLSGQPAIVRLDEQLKFDWTLYAPDTVLSTDHYSVRWTGKLTAPQTGKYKIGLEGNDGFRLYINNRLMIDNWTKRSFTSELVDYQFVARQQYDIRVEFFESVGNAHIRLVWNIDVKDDSENKIQEAVAIAKAADMAIVVAGIEEGEFRDRAMLSLPGRQEELIRRISATGTKVVVLLVGGSAITMSNWIDSADAILNIWYPGEAGGDAVAAILFGDQNPAGRLPITYPVHEAQLPLVYNHKPTGRGDDYDNLSGEPLFPFGYGLSYTSFRYSEMQLEKKSVKMNEPVTVTCNITNTGNRRGEEVVQLYIRDMLSSVARPVLELKGFQRIRLEAGERKQVKFTIEPSMLSMLNEKMEWVTESGDFRIMIGSSSRDLWLKQTLKVVE